MRKTFPVLLIFTFLLLGAITAAADTLNFDDLDNFSSVPSGYGGLEWSNLNALDSSIYYFPESGYVNGTVSPNNVLYNGGGSMASISGSTPFKLEGFYLTAAWNNNLNVDITGYNGENQIYTYSLIVNTDGPTLVELNWADLTRVTFSSYGGIEAGLGGGGEHFALDDLMVFFGIDFGTGDTPNQRAVLAVLNNAVDTAGGSFYDALLDLALLPDGAFQAGVDQLSPEVYAGTRDVVRHMAMAGANLVHDRLGLLQLSRTNDLNGKLLYASAGDVMRDTGPEPLPGAYEAQHFSMWARTYYMSADQERTDNFFGYDYDARGLTIGGDTRIGDRAYIGLLFGKAEGDLEYARVGAETDIESYYGGIYGAYRLADFYLHGQFSWTRHEFDTTRNISFTDPARVAKSDHTADEYSLTVGVDYLGLQPAGWNLIPTLSVQATYYDEDRFSESGAGGFNLQGEAFDQEYVTTRLGARVNRVFDMAKVVLIPEVSLEWAHEFGDTDREVKARFEGAADQVLVVEGMEPDRDSLLLGVGLAGMITENTGLFLKYNSEYGKDLASWDASLTLRHHF